MTKFKVPVDFTIYAKDEFHLQRQLNSFLAQSYREFAASYNIMDFELPVGYPTEESNA
jgi:hypothetical protein